MAKKSEVKADEKHVAFTMKTQQVSRTGRTVKGEDIDIIVPVSSLDEDGNAKSALGGIYRKA